MKVFLSLSLTLIILAGCSHTTEIETAANREGAAWQVMEQEAAATCEPKDAGNVEIPRDKIMALNECRWAIIQQNVLPVSMFPEITNQAHVEAMINAKAYQDGVIDWEEFKIRRLQGYTNWTTAMADRMDRAYSSALAQDESRRQRMQSVGASLIQQSNPQPITGQNVTCTGGEYFGGFKTPVQCRSW